MPDFDKPALLTAAENSIHNGPGEAALGDAFFTVLVVFVAFVAVLDFLLGRDQRRKIRTKIEDWWLFLQYTKFQRLGYSEAAFFSESANKFLGRRFFTMKRISGSFIMYVVAIIIMYILIVVFQLFEGKPLQLPFKGKHIYTGFPFHILSVIVSLYVTQLIVNFSIRIAEGSSFSNVRFFVCLLLFGGLGYFIINVITISLFTGVLEDVIKLPYQLITGQISYVSILGSFSYYPIIFHLIYALTMFYAVILFTFILTMPELIVNYDARLFGVFVTFFFGILEVPFVPVLKILLHSDTATVAEFEQGYDRFVDIFCSLLELRLRYFSFLRGS